MNNSILKILLASVSIMLSTYVAAFATGDTSSIYFRLDNPTLDVQATKKIDSLIYYDVINDKQELLIVGYADYIGTNNYNDILSENRAKNVKAYLQTMGIPEKQITLCMGKGEIPRDIELPDGYAADRRVDIVRIRHKEKPVASAKPVARQQKADLVIVQSIDAVKLNSSTDFDLDKIIVGQLFVLDKIFFYTGRHVVVDESIPELSKLYKIMDENLTLSIRIEGHVCCVHPSMDALDIDNGEIALSVNRAKYIYDYLVRKGIDAERLSYIGYGKTRPLRRSELTQEDQDMNKRVEIRIIKK